MKYLGYLLILIAFIAALCIRFNNIDMTETRLVMTFYRQYIGITGICLVGLYFGFWFRK